MTLFAELAGFLRDTSEMLDRSYPQDLDKEAHRWRRTVGKLTEELGEVADALLGLVGENPRKGVTGTEQDVIDELLDVAACALGGVEHMIGNTGQSMNLLYAHAQLKRDRLRRAIEDAKGCRPHDYHHLGPWERVPGSDSIDRCLSCDTLIGK